MHIAVIDLPASLPQDQGVVHCLKLCTGLERYDQVSCDTTVFVFVADILYNLKIFHWVLVTLCRFKHGVKITVLTS